MTKENRHDKLLFRFLLQIQMYQLYCNKIKQNQNSRNFLFHGLKSLAGQMPTDILNLFHKIQWDHLWEDNLVNQDNSQASNNQLLMFQVEKVDQQHQLNLHNSQANNLFNKYLDIITMHHQIILKEYQHIS